MTGGCCGPEGIGEGWKQPMPDLQRRTSITARCLSPALLRTVHHPETQRTTCNGAAEPVRDGEREAARDAAEHSGEKPLLGSVVTHELRMRDPRLPLQAAIALDAEQDRDL